MDSDGPNVTRNDAGKCASACATLKLRDSIPLYSLQLRWAIWPNRHLPAMLRTATKCLLSYNINFTAPLDYQFPHIRKRKMI